MPSDSTLPDEDFFRTLEVERTKALVERDVEKIRRMHAPDYYRQPPEALRTDRERNDEIEQLLHEKLERWEVLEAKAKAALQST